MAQKVQNHIKIGPSGLYLDYWIKYLRSQYCGLTYTSIKKKIFQEQNSKSAIPLLQWLYFL